MEGNWHRHEKILNNFESSNIFSNWVYQVVYWDTIISKRPEEHLYGFTNSLQNFENGISITIRENRSANRTSDTNEFYCSRTVWWRKTNNRYGHERQRKKIHQIFQHHFLFNKCNMYISYIYISYEFVAIIFIQTIKQGKKSRKSIFGTEAKSRRMNICSVLVLLYPSSSLQNILNAHHMHIEVSYFDNLL